MRRTILLLSFVGAMFLAFSGVVLAQTNTPRDSANENANERSADKAPLQKPERGSIPGRYIVVLNDDAKSPEEVAASEEEAASNAKEENDAREVANQHAADEAFTPDFVYNRALSGYAARLSDAQLERVRSKPEVKFVSIDHEVQAHQKTDPSSKSSKAQDSSSTQDSSKPSSPKEEEATAQGTQPLTSGDKMVTGVQRIGAGSATTAYQTANPSVAVIDTGIDLSHPDLNAYTGKNCVNPGTNPTARDDNGHGTHVAGTIGAKNNGSGVVGVAPGTKQFSVKVLNSNGSGSWSQVICGIDWVSNNAAVNGNNIQIANMSLGGSGSNDNNCGNTNSDALHQAICRSTNNHWVTYSVSAGNSGTGFWTGAPASYPEVLTVTAMSDSDGKTGGTGGAPTCRTGERDDYYATFSNYAGGTTDQNHTIGAPGVCILSSAMGGGTKTMSGTSMASPHVAGTIAVCVGTNGGAGPCRFRPPREKIQQVRSDGQAYATNTNGFSGDPYRPVSGKYYGYLTWTGGY